MRSTYKTLALMSAVTVIAGCQSMPGASPNYVVDSAAIVKAADWDKMQTVTLTMEEHSYAPSTLTLKAGQAYKIELRNVGDHHHYFTAPEFFRSVAWRKLMVNNNAEIKVDYVVATEVLKKRGQLDLYLVPVKTGTYTAYCTIEDHRPKGMEGRIIVE